MSETFESISFRDVSGLPSDWRDNAACNGLPADMFHPRRGENKAFSRASAICIGCIVINECLHYALSNNINVGIWGGKSERQRRMMRREIRQ
jgi:WhiB family redox-sensing transcriptional regulator